MIKVYHTDNGIFNTSKFMEDIFKKKQQISFIGAGASVENTPQISYICRGNYLAILFISRMALDDKYVSEGTGMYTSPSKVHN